MTTQSAFRAAVPVLVTRPQPQADRFAADLSARFGAAVRPVVSPLMQAWFAAPTVPPGPYSAVILTSETGALAAGLMRAGGATLPDRAYCVGDRTAEVAAEQGFSPLSAKGDAVDLAALILSQAGDGPLLYLHGQDRAADLGALLAPRHRVWSAVVYGQLNLPLSAGAETVLTQPGPVILPIFSPRSARLLAEALPRTWAADLRVVAISSRALAALPPALQAGARVADRPDAAALLQAISCVLQDAPP